LATDGHHVAVANGFADALACAGTSRFDVLLCDIGLPGRDGCELLAEVRLLYPIRGIAVTGYGMPEEVKRVMEAGFAECILKPSSIERVRAALAIMAAQIERERIGLLRTHKADAAGVVRDPPRELIQD
jgi:CheY-like chemotaxis protein